MENIDPKFEKVYLRTMENALVNIKICDSCDVSGKPIPKIVQKRFVFYGIKLVNLAYDFFLPVIITESQCRVLLTMSHDVLECMRDLTPRDIFEFFPIEKVYNGERRDEKDYYSSMAFVESLGGLDKPLGNKVCEFIAHMRNNDLITFAIAEITLLDKLSSIQGHEAFIQAYLRDRGDSVFNFDSEPYPFVVQKVGLC